MPKTRHHYLQVPQQVSQPSWQLILPVVLLLALALSLFKKPDSCEVHLSRRQFRDHINQPTRHLDLQIHMQLKECCEECLLFVPTLLKIGAKGRFLPKVESASAT